METRACLRRPPADSIACPRTYRPTPRGLPWNVYRRRFSFSTLNKCFLIFLLVLRTSKMVFKCCVVGCSTGYRSSQPKDTQKKTTSVFRDSGHDTTLNEVKRTSVFRFPFDKREICQEWVRFVNRANWKPTKSSVICSKHFEEKYIHRSCKRSALRWMLNPVPTILSSEQKSRLTSNFLEDYMASLPEIIKNPPPDPVMKLKEEKEMEKKAAEMDKIDNLEDLTEADAPDNYSFYKSDDNQYVVYYEMCYEDFPKVKNSIRINRDLKVKLQHDGANAPLPKWFSLQKAARLKKRGMLHEFPEYLDNLVEDDEFDCLEELRRFKYYDSRPEFSNRMIQQCLFIRSISPRVYELLSKMLPFPSVSVLNKMSQRWRQIIEIHVPAIVERGHNEATVSQSASWRLQSVLQLCFKGRNLYKNTQNNDSISGALMKGHSSTLY